MAEISETRKAEDTNSQLKKAVQQLWQSGAQLSDWSYVCKEASSLNSFNGQMAKSITYFGSRKDITPRALSSEYRPDKMQKYW